MVSMAFHSGFLEHWNSKKMFVTFDNVVHVYLMRGFQKYARNLILTMAFWATCKIAQPIQPIWQHIFALPWSALKKPPSEFNFFHIFGIPSSIRHEKRCQMLQTLFRLFQCSKNPRCKPKTTLRCTSASGMYIWKSKRVSSNVFSMSVKNFRRSCYGSIHDLCS